MRKYIYTNFAQCIVWGYEKVCVKVCCISLWIRSQKRLNQFQPIYTIKNMVKKNIEHIIFVFYFDFAFKNLKNVFNAQLENIH